MTGENFNELISRVYDVALDPKRYEEMLDSFESTVAQDGQTRASLVADPTLADHFERATAVLEQSKPATALSAADGLLQKFDTVAALIVSRRLDVFAINEAGRAVLGVGAGDPLKALPIAPEDRTVLTRQISRMLSEGDAASCTYRVRAADEESFLVFQMHRRAFADGEPVIIAATSDLRWPHGFDRILKDAFSLSAAETEVVRQLVECCNIQEIADTRGRSVGTVRSQIKTIMAKTETHSQAELVRLVLSMMDIAALTQDVKTVPRVMNGGNGALEALPIHTIYDEADRRLDYLVLGDPKGRPLLYMHMEFALARWPASAERYAKENGIRVIVPARGGYAGTDLMPKDGAFHTLVAKDILCVLDAEGVDRLPVISISDDCLLAMEVENQRPGTVSAILAAAGGLPYLHPDQVERLDKWYRFIQAGAQYTPKLLPYFVKMAIHLIQKVGKGAFLRAIFAGSKADLEALEDPEIFEALITGSEIGLSEEKKDARSFDTFVRQTLFEQEPWLVEYIHSMRGRMPVHFFNGLQDPAMPPETIAEHQVEFDWIDFRTYPDAGQLLFFKHWRDVVDLAKEYL